MCPVGPAASLQSPGGRAEEGSVVAGHHGQSGLVPAAHVPVEKDDVPEAGELQGKFPHPGARAVRAISELSRLLSDEDAKVRAEAQRALFRLRQAAA